MIIENFPIQDTFTALYHVHSLNDKDFSDLQDAFIYEPYLSKVFLNICNIISSENDLFSLCLPKSVDLYLNKSLTLSNLLFIIGQCLSLNESSQESIQKLVLLSKNNKCLLKHICLTIGIKQTPEERCKISNFLKGVIIDNLFKKLEVSADQIFDLDERLCYCLIVNNSFPLRKKNSKYSDLGWLILTTTSQGPIKILLSLINNLIERKLVNQLCTLLKSNCMVQFNKLLLVNLWHPDLANVTIMQVLLDTCFPSKVSSFK